MRQTKYMMSGGLAFSENKDMEKLRQLSLKGWHVDGFKFMGYSFAKGESSDYIYSVDYRSLKEDEAEEYLDFFLSAGWSHVASQGHMHLFRAQPHTKPIYSDRDTVVEKYGNSARSLNSFAIPLGVLTILAWIGAMISSGVLQSILYIIAVTCAVIAFPTAFTVIATYHNKWKVKERSGLFRLFTAIPVALFPIIIVILLVVNGSSVNMLVYMMVGAIAFPTFIWMIMSLYQKIAGKKA